MNKHGRQNKIVEIITSYEIETQEDLALRLTSYGIKVTQATVSRDIKELGLVKVASRSGGYMYALRQRENEGSEVKLLNLFKNCVISVKVARNIVVVKTLGGHGNSAGVAVDRLQIPEVVGSVAGDDTVIIVTDSEENAFKVRNNLEQYL